MKRAEWLLAVLYLFCVAWTCLAPGALITLSGVVTDSEGCPVVGIPVVALLRSGEQEARTTQEGYYELQVPAGPIQLWFGPPKAMCLVAKQVNLGDLQQNHVHDEILDRGYMISGRALFPGGCPLGGNLLQCIPISFASPETAYHLHIESGSGSFTSVLPPGVYSIEYETDPPPSYAHQIPLDLTSGPMEGLELILQDVREEAISSTPPDASKIDVGMPDDLGYVVIEGGPGAALPLAHVLVVNADTMHQAHTASHADGSFFVQVYAPAGSAVEIKHGYHSWRWREWYRGIDPEGATAYPGTTIHVPIVDAASPGLPFSANGELAFFDNRPATANAVGAAWEFAGTVRLPDEDVSTSRLDRTLLGEASLERLRFMPGDTVNIEGVLTIRSPAIESGVNLPDVLLQGYTQMHLFFDNQGRAIPFDNYFMSSLLTPSGFPIQGNATSGMEVSRGPEFSNLRRSGTNAIQADVSVSIEIPRDIPHGVYRPIIMWIFRGVPLGPGWVGAKVGTTGNTFGALLPPISVGDPAPPRLVWRLLMDDIVEGVRGTRARQDEGAVEFASQMVSQGARYIIPRLDTRTGEPIEYRLEPFLPMLSYSDRAMPSPPIIPFDLPGGLLKVSITGPDGTMDALGSAPFVQSSHRLVTTEAGTDLNPVTQQMGNIYSLTTNDKRFIVSFDRDGHYVIEMKGEVLDIWGNEYAGGGTYDVWVASTLDVDVGALPGTPFQVGNALNPCMQFHPAVPADVRLVVTQYPNSDPDKMIVQTIQGRANRFGFFSPADRDVIFTSPGEYKVEVLAEYEDSSGRLFMAERVWGGVVETPNGYLEAHGRRGTDALVHIPGAWFVSCRDLELLPGTTHHSYNPYFNGDIFWSRMSDAQCGGDSLVLAASVQDTTGLLEPVIRERAQRWEIWTPNPGSVEEQFSVSEMPLFTGTSSGLSYLMAPNDIEQLAYSYRYSQRPGERVREVVAEGGQSGGYWRLDTLYDNQMGVGLLGDQPGDFKFQYVGAVYRDLVTGINQYSIQGSLWICIPDDDPLGTRVMPPFAGVGNGGWTTEGGPILTLRREAIDMFIHPTGTQPGAILEVGDEFVFAGHIAPTLESQVDVAVTSPSGVVHRIIGQANKIGYFHDPTGRFTVDEPGVWVVDVEVWHDGYCSGGKTVPPYPSGSILGGDSGQYVFYAVPAGEAPLDVSSPTPGFLSFEGGVGPILITGTVSANTTDATVDYTITMPGYILEHGQVPVTEGAYNIRFDPASLHEEFPNLDLVGRDDWGPGLADTFSIGLLMEGQNGTATVCKANVVTIQGEQVFVESGADE